MFIVSEVKKLIEHVQANSYKHIVFDLDETIARLHLPWDAGMRTLFDRSPSHIAPQLRREFANGEPYGVVLNRAVKQYEEFLPILLAWAHEFEAQLVSQQPHDELVTAIAEFANAGRRLCLWTSNTQRSARQVLDKLGIGQHFDVIVARDDVRLLKPNPEGWWHIYGGEPLSDYLLVGDSVNDYGAAVAVGIDYFETRHFKEVD